MTGEGQETGNRSPKQARNNAALRRLRTCRTQPGGGNKNKSSKPDENTNRVIGHVSCEQIAEHQAKHGAGQQYFQVPSAPLAPVCMDRNHVLAKYDGQKQCSGLQWGEIKRKQWCCACRHAGKAAFSKAQEDHRRNRHGVKSGIADDRSEHAFPQRG